jgi:hypothetical protein
MAAGNQRGTDRWRPEHLAASGELFVPAVYNALRFGTHGSVSRSLPGIDTDVEPARPDPRGGIICSGVRQAKLEALALLRLLPGCLKASTISVPAGSSPG